MDGGSLHDMLKEGTLDLPLARQLAADVLRGLAYLHYKKVIHRDLKPENILITRERGIKAKIAG